MANQCKQFHENRATFQIQNRKEKINDNVSLRDKNCHILQRKLLFARPFSFRIVNFYSNNCRQFEEQNQSVEDYSYFLYNITVLNVLVAQVSVDTDSRRSE